MYILSSKKSWSKVEVVKLLKSLGYSPKSVRKAVLPRKKKTRWNTGRTQVFGNRVKYYISLPEKEKIGQENVDQLNQLLSEK
jgi:hypothetical protein